LLRQTSYRNKTTALEGRPFQRCLFVKRKPPAMPVVPKGFSYGEKELLLW